MLYGWDISTSIVGVSMFSNEGTYITSSFCDLRKVDGQLAKADAFDSWLPSIAIHHEKTNVHFIEERLGGFASGRTSAQVLMKLAQFNAICSYILYTYHVPVAPDTHRAIVYLHPSSWKSWMKKDGLLIPKGTDKKKEITLAFVRSRQPKFPYEETKNGNPQPWCFDMADSYCIGRAGFMKMKAEFQL